MRNETHFTLASLNERVAELLEDLNDRVMRRTARAGDGSSSGSIARR